MGYDISFDKEWGFVVVRVFVNITRDLVLEFGRAASEEARHRGVKQVLVDVRNSRSELAAFEQYELAGELHKAGVDRRLRVASVIAQDDRSHDFMETVTRNRGYEVLLFDDIDEAKAWLWRDAAYARGK